MQEVEKSAQPQLQDNVGRSEVLEDRACPGPRAVPSLYPAPELVTSQAVQLLRRSPDMSGQVVEQEHPLPAEPVGA